MLKKCKYESNLFKFAKEVKATDALAALFAFQPPKKHEYKIYPLDNTGQCFKTKQKHCCRYEKVKFVHDKFNNISYNWIEVECYLFKKMEANSKNKDKNLVIIHLKNKNKSSSGFTILMSHGNASTIGTIYPILVDMCSQLKCDIIAYDYSGYGKSEGKSSEKEIYSDIDEVGYFVKECMKISPEELIIMGHSLGSAPSIHLAINENFRDICAIILISPIASGIKLISPDIKLQDLENIDVFCNIKKIIDVTCPIFLIHGQKDEVIPIEQSIEMAKLMKYPYEWYPRNGDHSNILSRYRTKFFQKCKFFFEFIYYYLKRNTEKNKILDNVFQNDHPKIFNNIKINVQESYIANYYTNGQVLTNEENISKHTDNKVMSNISNKISSKSNLKTKSLFSRKNSNGFENFLSNNQQEFPFDINFQNVNTNTKNSKEISEERPSIDSAIFPMINKEVEDQYNKMLFKHNGI